MPPGSGRRLRDGEGALREAGGPPQGREREGEGCAGARRQWVDLAPLEHTILRTVCWLALR